MKKIVPFLFVLLSFLSNAQGDDCYNATVITNPGSFCYSQDFSNKSSTQMITTSGTMNPESCWSSGNNYDVWFTFTAVGTKLTVTVDGSQQSLSYSYLYGAGIALLDGTCTGNSSSYSTSFTPLGCVQGATYSSTATLNVNNLTKGHTYFIRISSTKGNRGDFGLCVINSDPAPSGSDDCTGAVKLCDIKTTPSVSSITSKGTKEETSTLKLNGVGMTEHQTIWYQFIAGKAGTLTFNIKPKTSANDIDFGLYQSSTSNACGTLTPLRINVTSCWVGDGSTGLNTTSTDQTEASGCSAGQDEFLQAVTLVPGTTYVLVIDNASPSASDGFDLTFGGTTTFSPDSLFTISPNDYNICTGDAVTFTPTTVVNNFTYTWLLDNNGTPQTTTSSSAQTKTFATKGIYSEKLTVTNSFNCTNSSTQKIYVNDKPQVTLTPSNASICGGSVANLSGTISSSGTIASGNSTANNNIKTITWSPTAGLTSPSTSGIGTQSGTASASTTTAGTYTLTVTDDAGCTNSSSSIVSSSSAPAPTCPGTNICTGATATLTATGNVGATFKWYADNTTNTTIAGSGTTGGYTTPALNTTTTYYVSQVSGGCESTRTPVTVTVGSSNTIALTSAVGTDAQSVCVNNPITNITYSTTSATGATFSGLPTGVTGVWNAGVITISGTPTTATGSPFTYTIALTGGCGTVTKTGTITIITTNTITLSSATGTDGQTVCINNPITNITYTTTGATGATITGLPAGVNGNWSTNVVTISGTPTTNTGSPFTYTISLTGGCGTVSKTGTITINPTQTLGVTCGTTTSSSVQFTWNNITGASYNYSYLINNTGAPTTGSLTAGTTSFTKNGLTPGDNVTITLTPVGGTCVTAETFSCTAVNCATPTVTAITSNSYCSGISIPTINFSSPDGGTSFSWSCNNTAIGLSANGTGNSIPGFTAATVNTNQTATISVTASNGGCVGPATTFTISVNPLNTITLTSPSGTDNQSICFNQNIQNITYQTTSATGATITGLPNGVTGNWNANQVSISGTPTVSSTTPYSYTITLTGGCGTVTKTGNITVNPLPTIIAGTDFAICIGKSTKLTGSGGTSYSWDNSVTDNISFSPTSTKTYTVTGTDANGCSNSDQIIVTVNPLPTAIVSNSSPACLGTTSLTVNETSGLATAWNWTTSGSATFNSNTSQNPTISNAINGEQFTVLITDANGCQNTSTTTVTINALPVFTPTAFSQCENDPLYVKANFNNPLNIVWSGPNGFTNTANNDNQVQVTSSALANSHDGIYSVDVTDQNNCTSTRTVTVSIHKLPIVNAGVDKAICIGQSITLTGSGANTYSWDKNVINNNAFSPTNTQTYTLTGTDAFGCFSTDQVVITVNPLPDFSLSVNTPCEQENLSFAVDLSNNPSTAGIKTSSWVGPNGFANTTLSPTLNSVTASNEGNYILTITDNNLCVSQKSIIANITPVDNIQFSDIEPTCVNGNIFRLPAVNIPDGTWSSDDNISIQDPYAGIFDPTKSKPDQDYKVVVTYSTKTIQPARQCPATKSKIVYVYPIPDTLYTIEDRELCITDTLKLKILNVDKNVTYQWDFNNGEFSNDTVVEYVYPQSGIFGLTLTAKMGMCVNKSIKTNYIKVIDFPESVDFSQSTNVIDFYNPEIQFSTTTNGLYYFWDFGDGKTSTYKNPKHTFPEKPGEYIIDLTVSNLLNSCGITVTRSILMPEPVIYFIPNTFTPNGDELNNTFQPIFTYGYDAQNYSFYIYNRWGELMFESHDPKIGWDGTYGDNFVQNDTYVWKLEFKEKIQEYKHIKTGHVNVMR